MFKIEAIIRNHKLDDAKMALNALGIQGMTVSEVRGFGHQQGHSESYRGLEYAVDFLPRIKLEIVVSAAHKLEVVDALLQSCRTGKVGDGVVVISQLDAAIRVRTGESSESVV